MADTDSDGIADAFDGHVRVALTVAQQMAEKFARLREELARTAQATTEQQTRELQARFDAERSAAIASSPPYNRRNGGITRPLTTFPPPMRLLTVGHRSTQALPALKRRLVRSCAAGTTST